MLSSQLLGSVLESAPDAIVIVDADGQILFLNRQMHALFGYERRELLGSSIDRLLPERFRASHQAHRERFAAGGGRLRPMGSGMELFGLHRSGAEFPVEIGLSPIHDGERMLVAAAIRDVTEHREAQNELLEARLAADRANSAKSRFLAMASHDLRQPLQSLGLLNASLRRLVRDEQALDALAQQEHAIATMARLLNALLDISKLESGATRADVTDFALTPLFEELCLEFLPLARAKNLKLRWTGRECDVRSDPALVGQILRNLVTNAIKYTAAGEIELRCVAAGERVLVEVADTGIGIAEEHLGAICDEFYQVGVLANASREGYGLGLSIVKRLVDLLGLQLNVRSELGRGSVFGLEIPRARGAVARAVRADSVPAPLATQRKARILLVEDDPAVRDATRMLLKLEGYAVVAVATREEAMAQASLDGGINLMVTDYHLGSVSGLDVIHALREQLGTEFNAIIITGDTSSAIRELPVDARLRLLSKPVPADELLAVVRELLQ